MFSLVLMGFKGFIILKFFQILYNIMIFHVIFKLLINVNIIVKKGVNWLISILNPHDKNEQFKIKAQILANIRLFIPFYPSL